MSKRRLIKLVLALLAVLGIVASAWAYWTTYGSGNASASVGTLNAPTNANASTSAGSTTVSVSWTGSTLSSGTAVEGYYVTRTNTSNSQSSAACGSSVASLISGTSCSDTGVADGTYTYKVTAVYHTWTAASAASNQVTVQGDITPPTVQSINRSTGSPTNTSSVQFAVAFSESVSGVDLSDFSLATSGVTGASKTSISGTGSSYTVTVDTGSGDGTVGLNLVDDDSIQDGAGNRLGGTGTSGAGDGSFIGQVYTIDKTAPSLVSLQMFDANANGKIDQVKATFSESLASYTAGNTPWTLTNVPSGGSLASVAVSGAVATLTITEGAGAADTSVGSFTVALAQSASGIRDSVGNQSSFSGQAPADKAGPTPVAIADTNGTNDGKFEQNDTMTVTFSETVTGIAATSNVVLTGGNGSGNDNIAISNVLSGSVSLGRSDYISSNGSTANFNSSLLSQPAANQVKLTLAACTGTGCANITQAASTGSLVFTPVNTITDTAGNTATGSLTVSIRLF